MLTGSERNEVASIIKRISNPHAVQSIINFRKAVEEAWKFIEPWYDRVKSNGSDMVD